MALSARIGYIVPLKRMLHCCS